MALWGMVIDLDRCTGCQACVMACKAENNVPAVGANEAKRGRVISWMQVLTETDEEHHEAKRASFHGPVSNATIRRAPRSVRSMRPTEIPKE